MTKHQVLTSATQFKRNNCKHYLFIRRPTADFDRSTSVSPPNKYNHQNNGSAPSKEQQSHLKLDNSITTPYTPGSQQKRFNPFMKDVPTPVTSGGAVEKSPEERLISLGHKKPLTPTKEHPLQDRAKAADEPKDDSYGEDDMDDDYGYCDNQTSNDADDDVTTDECLTIVGDAQNDENKNVIVAAIKAKKESTIARQANQRTAANCLDTEPKQLDVYAAGKCEVSTMNDCDDLAAAIGDMDVAPATEGMGIVKATGLQPGKVVRRKKTGNTKQHQLQHQRASFPLGKSILSRSIEKLDAQMTTLGSETDSSERLADAPVPDWVMVGESILIRPYNTSGVISFIGPTHFQVLVSIFSQYIM